MENISLILTDLDGTLFRNDKSISDYTKAVIEAVQKKGILFGISTSRALVNAEKFLDGITPDILITNGGGMVNVKDKKIYTCEFSLQEIRMLIKSVFDNMGSEAIISVDNEKGLYSNSKEELGDTFWTFNDFSDFKEPGMKICIKTLDKAMIEKVIGCIGLDKIDYLPFSDIPWYKLSKKGATKENAIRNLSEYLKLPVNQIAAFGDDFNDIGMLKLCGTGIAMANAIDEVKKVADQICDTNEEDGVARWIEKNLL